MRLATRAHQRITPLQRARKLRRPHPFLLTALFCLGLGIALPAADITVLRWPATLVLGSIVGIIGWRRAVLVSTYKRYAVFAIVLAVWLAISAVAAWDRLPLYLARYYLAWLVLITPGLASLIKDRAPRKAFFAGLVSGAAVYGFVVALRIAEDRPIFDVNGWRDESYVLGVNRNIGSAVALIAFPLILSRDLPRPLRTMRWPLATMAVMWIVLSRSRLVILGAVLMAVVAVMIAPGGTRKMRRLYIGILLVAVSVAAIQEIGGDARVSLDRINAGFADEGSTNEVRRLLVRKAWHFATENPAFGIGLGRFAGSYHPVIDEGSNATVRVWARGSHDHNGYAGLMAESGFPALVLLVFMFGSLLHGAVRNRASPAVRAATGAFVVALLYLFAESLLPITFASVAVLLGSIVSHELTQREHARSEAQQLSA